MIEAIALVRDNQEVSARWHENPRHLVQMVDQIRLMLDAVTAQAKIKSLAHDTQVTIVGDIVNIDRARVSIADRICPLDQSLFVHDVEIFYIWATQGRIRERPQLEGRFATNKGSEIVSVELWRSGVHVEFLGWFGFMWYAWDLT